MQPDAAQTLLGRGRLHRRADKTVSQRCWPRAPLQWMRPEDIVYNTTELTPLRRSARLLVEPREREREQCTRASLGARERGGSENSGSRTQDERRGGCLGATKHLTGGGRQLKGSARAVPSLAPPLSAVATGQGGRGAAERPFTHNKRPTRSLFTQRRMQTGRVEGATA